MATKRGQVRISLIHRHPMTKGAIVVISRRDGTRWQLVRSSGSLAGTETTDPALQRFLAWARERYPQAAFREVK